jgi:CRISPR-associated exonuclease Cas4
MEQAGAYTDDELLPLRYLNDLLFCTRRAALHMNEQIWVGNQYTAEGIYAHRRVDESVRRKFSDHTRVSSMMLVSRRLGLTGRGDLVEFHSAEASDTFGVPYPVDFKRGRIRPWDNDDVQLCAQALCLEEMLGTTVPKGAVFHIRSRHRREVTFDSPLRQRTIAAALRLHELVASRKTPPAEWKARCRGCSLLQTCMPRAFRSVDVAGRYLSELAQGGD